MFSPADACRAVGALSGLTGARLEPGEKALRPAREMVAAEGVTGLRKTKRTAAAPQAHRPQPLAVDVAPQLSLLLEEFRRSLHPMDLRDPVRFTDTVDGMYAYGITGWLEPGPGNDLLGMLETSVPGAVGALPTARDRRTPRTVADVA
nr:hypothetical protein OG999_04790 [Streptomyces sp. NBC_00886]